MRTSQNIEWCCFDTFEFIVRFEQDFLNTELYRRTGYTYDKASTLYWTDLRMNTKTNEYVWSNQYDVVPYTHWGQGQPKPIQSNVLDFCLLRKYYMCYFFYSWLFLVVICSVTLDIGVLVSFPILCNFYTTMKLCLWWLLELCLQISSWLC